MVLDHQGPVETAPLSLRDVPDPRPGPWELLVEVLACGVCRTDLHIAEGDLPLRKQPIIPGHEIIGRVRECGQGVQGFAPGDLVGVPWLYGTCAQCEPCTRERENLCEHADFTGWTVDGGYAELVVTRSAYTHHLTLDLEPTLAAPLMCAGAIGFRALRAAGLKGPSVLALYGFGASAHLTMQIARHWHHWVQVITRSAEHQALARRMRAAWVGGPDDEPPRLAHNAIIFAPNGQLAPQALARVEKGGRVVCAGIHMSDIPAMPYDLLYGERCLCSVANGTRADVHDLLTVAAEARVKPEVTTFPLEAANEALAAVKHSRVNGAAVLTIG